MNAATLSVVALGVVILASFGTRLNIGVLALSLAWVVAVYAADWRLDAVMAAFPSSLFLTLVGVTLLFGVAQANGTMAALTQRALALCGGRASWLPPLFFLLAGVISSLGPGAIATLALMAPLAMTAATRAKVPVLLAALMIGNGANAGNLSPFSAVGVVVAAGMAKIGLEGHAWAVFLANFTAHVLAAAGAWLLFGGLALRRATPVVVVEGAAEFTRAHRLTMAVGLLWMAAVVLLKVPIGLAAFAAAGLLILAHAADDAAALREVPWAVIVMVCGVSVLVAVVEGSGGLDLFSRGLASVSTPATINGTIAFITGAISTYSSTSGVVYPTFLPTVPSVVARLGGGDPLEIALSINVGAALVDVSPISTLGALCIAALPKGETAERLFRQLMLWSLAMTVVGAVFCQLFIRYFAF